MRPAGLATVEAASGAGNPWIERSSMELLRPSEASSRDEESKSCWLNSDIVTNSQSLCLPASKIKTSYCWHFSCACWFVQCYNKPNTQCSVHEKPSAHQTLLMMLQNVWWFAQNHQTYCLIIWKLFVYTVLKSDDSFKMSDDLLKIIRHIAWWSEKLFANSAPGGH